METWAGWTVCASAAALVAQEAQQADRHSAQRDRRMEVSRHVRGGEAHRSGDRRHQLALSQHLDGGGG
jgi:hypothetical protein